MGRPRKLKFFESEAATLAYITSELLATLRDDLAEMEHNKEPREDRAEMKAKIHDIEAIEGRIVLKRKPEPISGSDAVDRISLYWKDFKRAVDADEKRQGRDKQADQFIDLIARMTTEEEHGEDGMSGDDAFQTLSNLVQQARNLQNGRRSASMISTISHLTPGGLEDTTLTTIVWEA